MLEPEVPWANIEAYAEAVREFSRMEPNWHVVVL
jgi:hypothetical protein